MHCIFVLLTFSITSNVHSFTLLTSPKFGAPTTKDDKNGTNVNKIGKEIVREKLEDFMESELEEEAKLTSVQTSKGMISFYPHEKSSEKVLFSLNVSTYKNASSSLKYIVVGVHEISPKSKISDPWMTSVFLALKKCCSPSESDVSHYYALIAYVSQKDSNTTVVEWDRWSLDIMHSFSGHKKTKHQEVIRSLAPSLLCSYGSCACVACGCAMSEFVEPSADTKTRTGNAYTSSVAESLHGEARATAISRNGTAVAESMANEDGTGSSISYAKGQKDSVSVAKSGHGPAKATSISKGQNSFAQSNSQSLDGEIEVLAGNTGQQDEQYDELDDVSEDTSNESVDSETIFKDTNQAFEEAARRNQQTKMKVKDQKQPKNLCRKEKDINVSISKIKLNAVVYGPKGNNNKSGLSHIFQDIFHMGIPFRNSNGKAIFLENLLPMGIDIDNDINSSVVVASNSLGFTLPLPHRQSCCNQMLEVEEDNLEILKFLNQDCKPDLTSQIVRINDLESCLRKVLKAKKLSLEEMQDILPMLLLKFFSSKLTEESVHILENYTKNSTSKEITKITALTINAVHYVSTAGRLHKIKLMRGLALNVQNVWTGLLLEQKRCAKQLIPCTPSYLTTLVKDQNLVLGLYVFLKIADTLNTYTPHTSNPTDVFIRFLKLHKKTIPREANCKAKKASV